MNIKKKDKKYLIEDFKKMLDLIKQVIDIMVNNLNDDEIELQYGKRLAAKYKDELDAIDDDLQNIEEDLTIMINKDKNDT